MKKTNGFKVLTGLVVGTVMLGNMSVFAAESGAAMQQDKPTVTIGQTIADGSGNISDTILSYKKLDGKEYARKDYSQNANPTIFNERWTRGMYNALYQTYLDRDSIIPQNDKTRFNPYYNYANAVAKDYESRRTFASVMSDISRVNLYRFGVEPYTQGYFNYPEYFLVTVGKMDYKLDKATLDTLQSAKSLSDKEKVILFNRFVNERVTYDRKSAAGIEKVFTSSQPVKGACATYAYAFQYLCEQSGIPSISVAGDNHAWTMVYIDGKWLNCDPTNSKKSNDGLLKESIRFKPYDEQRVKFAKEILVPNSTK